MLRATAPEQERFYSQQIPLGVFLEHQAEATWVYEYRSRHGVYPSRSAFRARFPESLLPKTNEPLHAVVETITDADLFRQLTAMVDRARTMHEGGRTMRDVAEFFRRASSDIRHYDMTFSDIHLSSVGALRAYQDLVRRKNAGLLKPATPWATCNRLMGISMPGEMAVLVSRTNIGKTWCALYWAQYLVQQGERVLFISKELPSIQVQMRWISIQDKLSYPDLRNGTLPPVQLGKWVRRSYNNHKKTDVLISGNETIKGVGFAHIIQKIQEFKPTVLVVDGAYLIYPEERFPNDQQRFAFISSMLKRISMAYSLKTIAIVQAKREAESNSVSGVTKARLADIYGSDTWSQDADTVIMLNGKRGSSVRTLTLEKAREGEVGSWTIQFSLVPFPNLSEASVGSSTTTNTVSFQGV